MNKKYVNANDENELCTDRAFDVFTTTGFASCRQLLTEQDFFQYKQRRPVCLRKAMFRMRDGPPAGAGPPEKPVFLWSG